MDFTAMDDMQAQRDAAIKRELDLITELKFIRAVLDQPVTRNLRKENAIFDGDIAVIERHINAKCPLAGVPTV